MYAVIAFSEVSRLSSKKKKNRRSFELTAYRYMSGGFEVTYTRTSGGDRLALEKKICLQAGRLFFSRKNRSVSSVLTGCPTQTRYLLRRCRTQVQERKNRRLSCAHMLYDIILKYYMKGKHKIQNTAQLVGACTALFYAFFRF